LTNTRGECGISNRTPRRNLQQSLPNAALERRAANVELEIKPIRRYLDEAQYLLKIPMQLCLVADEFVFRKSRGQITFQFPVAVAEKDCTDALCTARDKYGTQGAVAGREKNLVGVFNVATRGCASRVGRKAGEIEAHFSAPVCLDIVRS